MAIEPVKIPQNVYVEDRIIGPVTLKQIIITGVGAGISYVLYSSFIRVGLTALPFQISAWIPAAIGAAFAFLRINDLSLLTIIFLMIESINKPHERVWSPHAGLSIVLVTRQAAMQEQKIQRSASETVERLAEMSRALEKRQQELAKLTEHHVPTPAATEPVRTQFQDVIAASSEAPVAVHDVTLDTPEVGNAYPIVQKNRIQTSALNPAYCIDTIHARLPRFAASRDPLA